MSTQTSTRSPYTAKDDDGKSMKVDREFSPKLAVFLAAVDAPSSPRRQEVTYADGGGHSSRSGLERIDTRATRRIFSTSQRVRVILETNVLISATLLKKLPFLLNRSIFSIIEHAHFLLYISQLLLRPQASSLPLLPALQISCADCLE